MSREDSKQVEDALDAIKKLVELSENKLGQDDTVLTLDHVVWRNPVSDAPEEAVLAAPAPLPVPTPKGKSSRTSSVSVSPHDLSDVPLVMNEPIAIDEIVPSPEPVATSPKPTEIIGKSAEPPTAASMTATPLNTAPSASEADNAKAEATRQRIAHELAQASEDVKELTAPLGRRGGGFYSSPDHHDHAKIAIKTHSAPSSAPQVAMSATMPEPPLQDASLPEVVIDVPASKAPEPSRRAQQPDLPNKAPDASSQRPEEIEPALTDFQGADFNFSVAEGLMTAADFESLEQTLPEIKPQIEVPLSPPPVANPVDEVHQMLGQTNQEMPADGPSEIFEEMHATPMGQPNLHVVSDQSAYDNDDGDEGFSGDVRMALRSLIKEQVSTWLQGNMTGLIEEALSTPNKRGSSKSKPKTTKR